MSTRRRVCHLVQDVAYGGVESLLTDLVDATNSEFDHHICYLTDRDAAATDLRTAGATVRQLDTPTSSPRTTLDPRTFPPLLDYLHTHDIDVLHAHHPLYPHIIARTAAALADVDHVIGTLHNQRTDFHPLMQGLEYLTRPLADTLVGVSDQTTATYTTTLDPPGWPTVDTITDGIDVTAFNNRVHTTDQPTARNRWDIPDDALLFVCVGRFATQKAHDDLIHALDTLHDTIPDAELLLIGHGPHRSTLETTASDLDIDDRVTIAGPVPHEEIHECYAAADAFTLASTAEGLGIAILEAMASALPVIATNVGGPSDVVRDGITGYLVPPRRPDQLAAAMTRMTDPQERTRLGINGFERVARTYDIDTIADAYTHQYRP